MCKPEALQTSSVYRSRNLMRSVKNDASPDRQTPQSSQIRACSASRDLVYGAGHQSKWARKESTMPQYKVVEMREGLIGGKMSGEKLEKVLNEHGSHGWVLKAMTAVEVKGRMGPGGVDGLLITFERE